MSSASFNAAYEAFIAGGHGAKSEVLDGGPMPVRITTIKGDRSEGKKFRVGVRFMVIDGEHKGKATWVNQSLTEPIPGDEKSTTAFIMFLKFMTTCGVPQEVIATRPDPTTLHQHIPQGAEGVAVFKSRPWKGKPQQDLVSFELTAVPSPMGGMVPVGSGTSAAPVTPQPAVAAPVAAPAVVAAPVTVQAAPVAPVAVPAPVVTTPVAAPVVESAVPAPSTVDVAALQAQLAALQAAQAQATVAAAVPAAAPIATPAF